MNSIWTNLLFLHGHVVPAKLLWRLNDGVDPRKTSTMIEPPKAAQVITAPSCKPHDGAKPACA